MHTSMTTLVQVDVQPRKQRQPITQRFDPNFPAAGRSPPLLWRTMQTTEVTASDPLPPPSGHDPPRSPKPRRLARGPQDTRDMHGWTRIAIARLHTAQRRRVQGRHDPQSAADDQRRIMPPARTRVLVVAARNAILYSARGSRRRAIVLYVCGGDCMGGGNRSSQTRVGEKARLADSETHLVEPVEMPLQDTLAHWGRGPGRARGAGRHGVRPASLTHGSGRGV